LAASGALRVVVARVGVGESERVLVLPLCAAPRSRKLAVL